jgi:hypothetical protein
MSTLGIGATSLAATGSLAGDEDAGRSTVLDLVRDFGATCDPEISDSPALDRAIAEAEASGGPSAAIRLGRYHRLDREHVVRRGLTIEGGGQRATLLAPAPTFSGWMLTIDGADRDGEWQAEDTTYDPAADRSGVELRHFMVNGLDRSRTHQGLRVLRGDDVLLDNVGFGFLRGTALQLGSGSGRSTVGAVRESDLRRVRVYKSGDGPEVPAVLVQNSPVGSGDGTNQVYAHQCRFVYNHGGIVIRNDSPRETLRRVVLSDTQLHGLSHGGSVGNAVDHDLLTIEGGVISVVIQNLVTNGSAAGKSVIRCRASRSSGRNPSGLVIQGLIAGECDGDIVKVDALADLSLEGRFSLGSIKGKILRVRKGSQMAGYRVEAVGTGDPDGRFAIARDVAPRGTVSWFGKRVR